MDREAEQAYLEECVRLIPEAIEEEYTRLSADLAYWGQRYADALRAALDAELDRKKVWGQRFHDLAMELEVAKQKAPTVVEREAAVERDVAYLAARARENRAEAEKVRIHGVMTAIKVKGEMLVSLGAHMRAEREASKYGEREFKER